MLHKNAQFRSSGFMPKPDQLTKAWLYQKRVFGPLLMTWLWRQGNSEITRIRSFLFTFEICLLQRGTIKSISDIKKDRKMNQGHKSHQNCQIKQCIWLCILAKSKDVNIFIKENHSHVNGSLRSLYVRKMVHGGLISSKRFDLKSFKLVKWRQLSASCNMISQSFFENLRMQSIPFFFSIK